MEGGSPLRFLEGIRDTDNARCTICNSCLCLDLLLLGDFVKYSIGEDEDELSPPLCVSFVDLHGAPTIVEGAEDGYI